MLSLSLLRFCYQLIKCSPVIRSYLQIFKLKTHPRNRLKSFWRLNKNRKEKYWTCERDLGEYTISTSIGICESLVSLFAWFNRIRLRSTDSLYRSSLERRSSIQRLQITECRWVSNARKRVESRKWEVSAERVKRLLFLSLLHVTFQYFSRKSFR